MISKFEVKDFKCHEDWNEFIFPGLTVVSGTNNSGKSSLLQSLYILTQNKTVNIPILSLNEQLRLGTYSDILNKGKRNDDTIEFSISFQNSMLEKDNVDNLNLNFIYINPATLQEIEYKDINPVLKGIEVKYKLKSDGSSKYFKFMLCDNKNSVFYEYSNDSEQGYCKIEGLTPEPIIYLDYSQNKKKFGSDEYELIRSYTKLINNNNIKYLKAYRVDDYRDSGNLGTNGIGISGEFTAEVISLKWNSTIDFFDENNQKLKFSNLFDIWIKKLLGKQYLIRSEKVDKSKYRIVVKEPKSNLELGINQVGFGISQLLPIITLILSSNRNDIIIIENPEIHLHPKLQADLVDLFIFAMQNGRKIILETHSENIINRLRLRIKQDNNLINKTNIYFFEKEEDTMIYQQIEIDKFGKIDYWPENFLDQSYYDLLGLIKK